MKLSGWYRLGASEPYLELVPTIAEVRDTTGPVMVMRYNMYSSAAINGNPSPGTSSGQAIEAMQAVAKRELPGTMSTDWTELTFLQLQAGNSAMFVFALAVNWVGDSLDGTVARVRGQLRPRYGYYVDHVIDLAGATLLFAGIAYSGVMSPLIAAGVLAGYLLVSAETGFGIGALKARIARRLGMEVREVEVDLPLSAGRLVAVFRREGFLIREEYRTHGVRLHGHLPERWIPAFRRVGKVREIKATETKAGWR